MDECEHKYIKGNACADCGEPMVTISKKEWNKALERIEMADALAAAVDFELAGGIGCTAIGDRLNRALCAYRANESPGLEKADALKESLRRADVLAEAVGEMLEEE